MNLRVQASDAATVTALDYSGPFSQAIVITGSAGVCTLTLNGLLANNPENRQISVPRNMLDLVYSCLGANGQTTPPLTIASTF
jgi:hypothetical protein